MSCYVSSARSLQKSCLGIGLQEGPQLMCGAEMPSAEIGSSPQSHEETNCVCVWRRLEGLLDISAKPLEEVLHSVYSANTECCNRTCVVPSVGDSEAAAASLPLLPPLLPSTALAARPPASPSDSGPWRCPPSGTGSMVGSCPCAWLWGCTVGLDSCCGIY